MLQEISGSDFDLFLSHVVLLNHLTDSQDFESFLAYICCRVYLCLKGSQAPGEKDVQEKSPMRSVQNFVVLQ